MGEGTMHPLLKESRFVHGPTLFAGLSKHVGLKLVGRLEFGFGAVTMSCALSGRWLLRRPDSVL
jgi:hypothetical protein